MVEFPLYIGSKKGSMPKNVHKVNMHALDFKDQINTWLIGSQKKRYQVKITYSKKNLSLEGYQIKDTSKNEISIDTQ